MAREQVSQAASLSVIKSSRLSFSLVSSCFLARPLEIKNLLESQGLEPLPRGPGTRFTRRVRYPERAEFTRRARARGSQFTRWARGARGHEARAWE